MKLNLGSGSHPLDGFINLDLPEWSWSKPLPYEDESVAAITISHALYLATDAEWTFAFSEMRRVLAPCGVVRITEDATDDPRSDRFGGFAGYRSLTSALRVLEALRIVGLYARDVHPWEGRDRSLIQRWHGEPPKVFHVEGVKV